MSNDNNNPNQHHIDALKNEQIDGKNVLGGGAPVGDLVNTLNDAPIESLPGTTPDLNCDPILPPTEMFNPPPMGDITSQIPHVEDPLNRLNINDHGNPKF